MPCLMCATEPLTLLGDYRCADRPSRYLFQGRSLVQCPACDFIQISPLPSEAELTQYYQSVYRQGTWKAGYDLEQFPIDNLLYLSRGRSQAQLVERYLPPSGSPVRILDIGGGYGHFAWGIRERYPQATIFVCEPDPACAPSISKSGATRLDGFLGTEASDSGVIRHQAPYDVAILSHVLEHPVAPKLLLRRSVELLRPGGLVLVEVPNCPAALLVDDASHAPHLSFFTADTLRRLIQGTGGEILFLDSCGPRRDRRRDPVTFLKRVLLPKRLRSWIRMVIKRTPGPLSAAAREAMTRDKNAIPEKTAIEYGGTDRVWLRAIAQF